MKKTEGHKIFSGFVEWFQHEMLKPDGLQAFSNQVVSLYEFNDKKTKAFTLQSPYPSWVYDQSIDSAVIPTSASLGVDLVDYKNGRVLNSTTLSQKNNVEVSIPDFRVYSVFKSDAEIVDMIAYAYPNGIPNPIDSKPNKPFAPHSIVPPCIFLKPEQMSSTEYAFGGEIKTEYLFVASILSFDEFSMFGIADHFQKKINSIFYYFDDMKTLNNQGGYFSSAPYNYKNKVMDIVSKQNLEKYRVFIDSVNYIPIEAEALSKPDANIYYGRLSFLCSVITTSDRKSI